VDGFTFIYIPASEIHLTSLTFAAFHGSTSISLAGGAPTPVLSGNSLTYVFTPAMLANFPNGEMTVNDRIHVVETFDVVQCSLPCSAANSTLATGGATRYDVICDCSGHPCNVLEVTRSALVEASGGGVGASYNIENPPNSPNLVFCPSGSPSDLVIHFPNSTYDTIPSFPGQPPLGGDKTPGSAKRQLHTITYQIKLEDLDPSGVFPLSSVFLEGSMINLLPGTVTILANDTIGALDAVATLSFASLTSGTKLYWSDGVLLGTVASVSGSTLTLTLAGRTGAARIGQCGTRGVTAPVPVMNLNRDNTAYNPLNFYNYAPATHLVTLNFGVLSAASLSAAALGPVGPQPLGATGLTSTSKIYTRN
jgi:hypothetical protein